MKRIECCLEALVERIPVDTTANLIRVSSAPVINEKSGELCENRVLLTNTKAVAEISH